MSHAIAVHGLSKRFGTLQAVSALELEVAEGEIYGFLGPNGSGKTTCLRMLCGLLTPDSGQGRTLGCDIVRERDTIKAMTGYMPQRFGLYDELSLRENLDFVARVHALPQRHARVDQALEQLGLEARAGQPAGTLSGGWKQRLALAACTLHRPRLLLLDEPTAGIDPEARREFWEAIHQQAASGVTVLVSTHYMDEAERCHRLAYLSRGRLLACDTPQAMVAHAGLCSRQTQDARALADADAIAARPGVVHLTRLGYALRVCARGADALDAALSPWGDAGWQDVPTALEDVFVALMQEDGP